MSEPLQQLTAVLKQQGQSVTTARQMVFIALQSSEPQSMHQLVRACPNINRASIYRTISLFERLGIVQRLQIGWKYKLELTDSFVHHHHHLSCVLCGSITALPEDAALENRLLTLAKQHDFVAQDHQLEIRGLCSTCAT